jgi:hypothetical protein
MNEKCFCLGDFMHGCRNTKGPFYGALLYFYNPTFEERADAFKTYEQPMLVPQFKHL